jgi:putative FmdB family regulatory protein
MPIFEYECEKCGIFDVLQLAGDKAIRYCPTCAKKKKKSKVRKVVSSPAFHLKGTGWYKTDYASKSSSENSSSEKSSTETSSGSKGKASDSDESKKTAVASGSEEAGSKNSGDFKSTSKSDKSKDKKKSKQ